MEVTGIYQLHLQKSFLFLSPYVERRLDEADQLYAVPSVETFSGGHYPYLVVGTEDALNPLNKKKHIPLLYRGKYLKLPLVQRNFLQAKYKVVLIGMGGWFELWEPQNLADHERACGQEVWSRLEQLSLL